MNDRTAQLRVKIKYLAQESKIIRHEERRAKRIGDYDLFFSLQDHRRGEVGHEARHSLLAYGFLRGRPYARLERTCAFDNKPDWRHVRELAMRFGPCRAQQDFRNPEFVERMMRRDEGNRWRERRLEESEEDFNIRHHAFVQSWECWLQDAKDHLELQDREFRKRREQSVSAIAAA